MSDDRDSRTRDRPGDIAEAPRSPAGAIDPQHLVGQSVLHFRVLERLGEGGMGVVYRAIDEKLRRHVALKVLAARYVVDDRNKEMIFREARSAAALTHPNIAAIYDVHDVPGGAFYVMELVEGETLRARITRTGRASVEEGLRWAAQIARALACAHRAGVVHRDLKTDNVMLTPSGDVKLLDFGLAKVMSLAEPVLHGDGERPASPPSALAPTMHAGGRSTQHGHVMGTPAYMAPEQSRGEAIDARADVFAFGVVLYELLTGTTPFEHRSGDPREWGASEWRPSAPLRALNPRVPKEIERIVARCLEMSPANRFADGSELEAALAGTVARDRPRLSPRVAAVALLGVGAVGVSAWIARRTPRPLDDSSRAAGMAATAPAASARECTTNRECVARNGGKPFVCNARGVCASVESADCTAHFEPSDLERDDTVWVGSMFPTTGEQAATFGQLESNAVELGRRDFAATLKSVSSAPGRPAARRIAVVACDDAVDASRAARHLVDDVGVPAVIGFRNTAETIDLATSLFVPHDVVTFASVSLSPLLKNIPDGVGRPRMVWRTTYDTASTAKALSALVTRLEGALRARHVVSDDAPMRVAFARPTSASIAAEELMGALRYNGKSAVDNDQLYREVTYGGVEDRSQYERVAQQVATFQPHVLVFAAEAELLDDVERAWPKGVSQRPYYLSETAIDPETVAFLAKDPERRRRLFGVTSTSTTTPNARFVQHYNETFPEPITRTFAPNGSYDAFYVAAYATFAVGADGVDGPALARSIAKLVPPGAPVDVGLSGILGGLRVLQGGGSIDLDGAVGKLDFDLKSGEAPVDFAIVCASLDTHGVIDGSAESGLVYDSTTGTLGGRMQCR